MTTLAQIRKEYDELQRELENPALISNLDKYKELGLRLSKLEKVIKEADAIALMEKEIAELTELERSPDEDIAQMARDELPKKTVDKKKRDAVLEKRVNPDPDEEISKVILEIRAGAGGQEAALFAGELY